MSKKNEKLPEKPNPTVRSKPFSFGQWALLLAIGLLLGVGIRFAKASQKKKTVQAIQQGQFSAITPVVSGFKFLNPQLRDPNYSKKDPSPILNLEKSIANYCGLIKGKWVSSISVVYYDLGGYQRIEHSPENNYAMASLSKVPLMMTYFKLFERDKSISNLKLQFTHRRELDYMLDDSKEFRTGTPLREGNFYTIEQLLYHMIVDSDNESTFLLLDWLGINYPLELTYTQQYFGFFVPNMENDVLDFVDIRVYARFFRALYNASFLNKRNSEKALKLLSSAYFPGGMRESIPTSITMPNKFGFFIRNHYTMQIHQFAIVYHPKKTYLLGVMTKGEDGQKLRKAIQGISKLVYEEVQSKTAARNGYLARDVEN